jgi:hypothetical protein
MVSTSITRSDHHPNHCPIFLTTDQNVNRRTNFIYHTDPNGSGGANDHDGMKPSWPAYGDKRRTTLRFSSKGNTLIRDDFHEEQIAYFFDKQATAW